MAAEPALADELKRLRACVSSVTGALLVGYDGRVIAEDFPAGHAYLVGDPATSALEAVLRLVDACGGGPVQEFLAQGRHGWVAVHPAGPTALLTLVTEPRANVGRIRLEARRSSARISVLIEDPLRQMENTSP